MQRPIPVDILSDSDSDSEPGRNRRSLRDEAIDLTTPPPFPQSKKKQKTDTFSNPSNSTVFIIDDDPTPIKSNTHSFVADTPFSDASFVKCSRGISSFSGLAPEELVVAETPISELPKPKVAISTRISIAEDACPFVTNHNSGGLAPEELVVAETPISELPKPKVAISTRISTVEDAHPFVTNHNSGEIKGWICVDSDDESEDIGRIGAMDDNASTFAARLEDETGVPSRWGESSSFSCGTSFQHQKKDTQNSARMHILEDCSIPGTSDDGISEAHVSRDDKASKLDDTDQILNQRDNNTCFLKEKKKRNDTVNKKGTAKEERLRLMEEKKRLKEQEKLLKAASKAEAAELKKREKEMQKWEKGKYALKSIVAEIDTKVIELGAIGGHLLTRFAEKGLSYRITSNPVERTIIWNMAVPEEVSLIAPERITVSYILVVYEAEEFCNLVVNKRLMDHVKSVQRCYPHHTVCYVTNKLMAYINKREQAHYKNPANNPGWKRPAVEEAFAKLTTHFSKVHSRQCVDEAELAEHVVGLTCSLANCQFRKRLTRFSVNANGSAIPKDCVDRNLIKKNLWLKVLVAIPKVQPRFAIAIWKKYPTMKSLLRVYMDPKKSVHEKEFLLKDLTTEGLLGDDRRLGEVCSKRMYRILMAQSGHIKTDDVEDGADFFNL
ncbi:crossover junction endonuclease EME1B isoform X1 [Salvia hispanica]|uniref:crossover junction endonuclease EME1B isoform X1 n=1 Tax=Salvia hispanica TaxID=49212 RepID=UPI00200978F8|nr:crossover junction endonuclease EME1B isoform X1 [Salvia hispanica]